MNDPIMLPACGTAHPAIRSVGPSLVLVRQAQDWTRLIAEHAPCPARVTHFQVQEVDAESVRATIIYGVSGVLTLDFWRCPPEGDETGAGHALIVGYPDGDFFEIASEHRQVPDGRDARGRRVFREVPNTVPLAHTLIGADLEPRGALELDGDKLIALMLAVHDTLVPAAFVPR